MVHGSKKAVLTAIVCNGIATLIKFTTALVGGSAAMMSTAVHGLMDCCGLVLLYHGMAEGRHSVRNANSSGQSRKKGLWNLRGGVGLYTVAAGLCLAYTWHAWQLLAVGRETVLIGVFGPYFVDPRALNLVVFVLAFLIQGYAFVAAARVFMTTMRHDGFSNPWRYLPLADDSTLAAVVLKGSAAMLVLVTALLGAAIVIYAGSDAWDLGFSVLIALLPGLGAFYHGVVNMRLSGKVRGQAGRSAP